MAKAVAVVAVDVDDRACAEDFGGCVIEEHRERRSGRVHQDSIGARRTRTGDVDGRARSTASPLTIVNVTTRNTAISGTRTSDPARIVCTIAKP